MRQRKRSLAGAACIATAVTACAGGGADTSSGSGGSASATSGSHASSSAASGTGGTAPTGAVGRCGDAPPPGAVLADPLPIYAGTCPVIIPGPNTIQSSGAARQFIFAAPSTITPGEPLPVVFLWHWLGGSAQAFYDQGDVAKAVETQHFLAVIPDKKGDLPFSWPFALDDDEARMDEEFAFFDDLLACVAAQFPVDKECVATAGVSAGALFTDQLAGARSNRLASFVSLSGGVDATYIKPWRNPPHALPGIVLWGGPTDQCVVIDFPTANHALEHALEREGNFFVECVDNCGHAAPPFDAPPGLSTYAGLWQFAFDHPFWTGKSNSPYLEQGLNPNLPLWCGIGRGSAVPRTGPCPPPGC